MSRILSILLLIALFLPHPVQAQSVQTPYIGMWIGAAELAKLPTSGAAWTALKRAADSAAGTPDLSNQDQENNVLILAKALVYARTGEVKYRTDVLAAIKALPNTENGGRTLALGRELAAYIIAADLINLPEADPALHATFSAWLRSVRGETLDGKTLISTHEQRPNNWGTHAGASRIAAALYLKDTADLERAALVFQGWLGDRDAYSDFDYGALFWQCSKDTPVAINPPGCKIDGHDVGGSLPEEMRRAGGGFTWPPAPTGYAWEAMQGAVVQAWLLHRAGYAAFEWSDRAILRAVEFLYGIGWEPTGDDVWIPFITDHVYGTNYAPAANYDPGKNMGWSEWTHAGRAGNPGPVITATARPTVIATVIPTIVPTVVPSPTPDDAVLLEEIRGLRTDIQRLIDLLESIFR